MSYKFLIALIVRELNPHRAFTPPLSYSVVEFKKESFSTISLIFGVYAPPQ